MRVTRAQVASAVAYVPVAVATGVSAAAAFIDARVALIPSFDGAPPSARSAAAALVAYSVLLAASGAAYAYTAALCSHASRQHHRARVGASLRNALQATAFAMFVAAAGVVAHAIAFGAPDTYTPRAAAATIGCLAPIVIVVYLLSTQSYAAMPRRLPDALHVRVVGASRR